jgi:[NiFe] hydrogenase diaphorase moiety large subunit
MQVACHCGLGQTAPNPVLDRLDQIPEAYQRRLRATTFEPAFDLNAALEDARQLTGRSDSGAYLNEEDLMLGTMP